MGKIHASSMSELPTSAPGAASSMLLNNRYRLLATVAAGGMATVYKAQDQLLNRLVAVKILRDRYARDPQLVQRFREEASAAASLNHPNIVTIFDVGNDMLAGQQRHYIVMELIEGEDLKQHARGRQIGGLAFDVHEAVNLLRQVCEGVAYAHKRGLVHCDLKPQNVMVGTDGRAKVTDFGIARAFTRTLNPNAREEVVWGTPQYYAPEQAAGAQPTPASDVYSIGIMLYELLAGKLPFIASDNATLARMHQSVEAPSLSDANPSVTLQLEALVKRALAKDPAQRYRNADQMAAALTAYLQQGDENTLMGMAPVTPQSAPHAPQQAAAKARLEQAPAAAKAPVQPAQRSAPLPSASRAPSIQERIAKRSDTDATAPTDATGSFTQYTQASQSGARKGGFDPLLLLLSLIAILCVLGLIPLWASVATEYNKAVPASAPIAPADPRQPSNTPPNAPDAVANAVTPSSDPGLTPTATVALTPTATPTPSLTLPTTLVGSVLDDNFKTLAVSTGISLVITDTFDLAPENTILAIEPNSTTIPVSSTLAITVSSGGRVRLEAQMPNIVIDNARFERMAYQPGMTIQFNVLWRAIGPVGRDYKVLVHLIAPNGQLVAQDRDGAPRNNGASAPTAAWGNGTLVLDTYTLAIPLSVAPGNYEVRIGLYDDNGRVQFLSPGEGVVRQDSLVIRTVRIE
jgi:serine/threonine-protein kinase